MNLASIRTDSRYLVSPQLTSTEYSDANLDRNANEWYKKAIGWGVAAGGDWQIAGDTIYRDFKPNVTQYDLPIGLIRILKGELLYETGGTYVPITFFDVPRNQGSSEANTTRTIDDPLHPTADLFGTKLEVRPAQTTSADIVNGIMLYVQMTLDDMVDDTDQPGLLDILHRIISKGAAYDYCMAEEMFTKAREIKYEIYGDPRFKNDDGLKGELEALYSMRSAAYRDGLSPRRRSYK